MSKKNIGIALLMVALMVVPLAVATEMNESVPGMVAEMDDVITVPVNVSAVTISDDGILPFPQDGDTLISGVGYLLWETDLIGNDYKMSVGLVPEGMEVNSSNAEWVAVREITSDDYVGYYYIWHPPLMSGKKYSLILLVDYEAAGMGRGTYHQKTFVMEGSFFLIDPPSREIAQEES